MYRIGLLFSAGLVISCAAPVARAQAPCMPLVETIPPSRALPHSFYDQASASLAALYPDHEVLVERRSGALGTLQYALIVYRQSSASDSIEIAAAAVTSSGDRAWSVNATCAESTLPEALVSVMETLANLDRTSIAPSPESREGDG